MNLRREGWPAQQTAQNENLDLRAVIGVLQRQLRLIIVTVVIILAATSAFVFSLKPSYQASTLLLIDTTRKDLLTTDAQLGSSQADSARVESEVEILRSTGVLMDVVASQQLVTDPEFGVRLGLRDRIKSFLRLGDGELPSGEQAVGVVLGNLRQAVSIQRRGLTYIVSIDVRSTSADKAARIANAIADVYIDRQVQSKVDATLVRRDTIRNQIAVARQSVVDAEGQYANFVSDRLDELVGATGQADLRGMRDSLQQLTSAQQSATNEMETLRRGLSERNSSALAEQLQSTAAQELARQRQTIIASLGQPGASGERAVNLRLELSRVEATLAQEAQRRMTELETAISTGQSQLSQTRANLNSSLLRANLPPDIQARIYELLQVSSNATTSYQTLLSRLQDLETQASLQVADSRVVSPALPPVSPSFPRTGLILASAGLMAVAVGIGLSFLFDNFIGGFTSASQLSAVTGRRLAAVIPMQRKAANVTSVADTLITRPISRYSESIRRLQATLERTVAQRRANERVTPDRGTIIMVTSSLPSEGKTTVALSLGRSLVHDGKRVLLIDCDLRRPSIHKQINVTPSASLPDLLNGKLTRDDVQHVTIKDPKSDLRIILGKREVQSASDQITNRVAFAQLMEAVSRLFDYIILDTPPIEPVVDGLYLSAHADAIAFVVHAAKTSQSIVLASIKSLDEANPPRSETVVVLNREVEDRFSTYGAYGGYYSD